MSLTTEFGDEQSKWRRLFDVTVAAIGLVLLYIPYLIISALIRRDSPGPAMFSSERVGKGGKRYKIRKLRTMYLGSSAESVLNELTDERITRIGRKLRRRRIDELMQLKNVWDGEMSIFGPRPEDVLVDEVHTSLTPDYTKRYEKTLPGITGYAQLFGCESSLPGGHRTKLALDLYYLEHRSIWFDAWIVLQTIRVVVTGRKLSINEHPPGIFVHLAPQMTHAAE